MRYVTVCLYILFLNCLALHAQEVTAGIYGKVEDSSSAIIANATVTLKNLETGRTYEKTTDAAGNYVLTLIPLGNYEATALSAGFKKETVTGLTLNVNDNRRLDFKLQVGQVADSVNVSADAAMVDTANGTTDSIIPEKTIQSLPSTARAVAPFALLMPGAITSAAGTTSASDNYTSVDGIRPTHNAWTLDGGL